MLNTQQKRSFYLVVFYQYHFLLFGKDKNISIMRI